MARFSLQIAVGGIVVGAVLIFGVTMKGVGMLGLGISLIWRLIGVGIAISACVGRMRYL